MWVMILVVFATAMTIGSIGNVVALVRRERQQAAIRRELRRIAAQLPSGR